MLQWLTAKRLSVRFPRACCEYLDHSQNSSIYDSYALAVCSLYHYLHSSCVVYCSPARARAICHAHADSLLVGPINAPHTLPPLLCDHQVRWVHINKQRSRGVETGVLLGAGRVECRCRSERSICQG